MAKILAGPAWAMAVIEEGGKVFAATADKNEWGNDYTPEKWATCRKAELPEDKVFVATAEMEAIQQDRMAKAPVMNHFTDIAVGKVK